MLAEGTVTMRTLQEGRIGMVVASVGLALLALTQPIAAQPRFRQACQADIDRFCKDAQPGGGFRACLGAHAAELSADCRAQLESAGAGRGRGGAGRGGRGGMGPCRTDLDEFCQGVEAGQGRFRQCLQAHQAELSETCREHLRQTGPGLRGPSAPPRP